MLKSDENVLESKKLVQQFEELLKALDKCCGLALQQPLPTMQLALMTDAAAGYAFLIEEDPNQKFTSLRKSYAPSPMVQKPSPQPKSRCPYMQRISCNLLRIQTIWTHFLERAETGHYYN